MPAPSPFDLPLFIFGTLMDEDVLSAVLGHVMPPRNREPAIARGWRRPVISGRTYPMLSPHPGGRVEGVLLRGLDERDRDRLDYYEGPEYRLGLVEVRLADGAKCSALAYLCLDNVAAERTEWRLDTWRLRHKQASLRRIRSLMANWRG